MQEHHWLIAAFLLCLLLLKDKGLFFVFNIIIPRGIKYIITLLLFLFLVIAEGMHRLNKKTRLKDGLKEKIGGGDRSRTGVQT